MKIFYSEKQHTHILEHKRFRVEGWKAVEFYMPVVLVLLMPAMITVALWNKPEALSYSIIWSVVAIIAAVCMIYFQRRKLRFDEYAVSMTTEQFGMLGQRAANEEGWRVLHQTEDVLVVAFWGEVITLMRAADGLLVNSQGSIGKKGIGELLAIAQNETSNVPVKQDSEWTASKTFGRIGLYLVCLVLIALAFLLMADDNFFIPVVLLFMSVAYLVLDIRVLLSKRRENRKNDH